MSVMTIFIYFSIKMTTGNILHSGLTLLQTHYEQDPEIVMTVENDIPDPDRGEDDILENGDLRPPPVLIQGDTDTEEEDREEAGHQGYTMLGQGEDQEEEEEEEAMTREEELAALVRAAQSDQENLSGQTQEMISQAR